MTDVSSRPVRIATRASRLALWQAEHVAALATGTPSPLPARLAARVAPLRNAIGQGVVQPIGRADG